MNKAELFGDVTNFLDSQGKVRTISLFVEAYLGDNTNYEPIFTLAAVEKKGCISLFQEFMKDEDPTGYRTALRVFGAYDVWRKLKGSPLVAPHIERWEDELYVKMRSDAISKMSKMNSPMAAKYIAERGWEKIAPTRGRPSKAEVKGELKKESDLRREVEEDAGRVFN